MAAQGENLLSGNMIVEKSGDTDRINIVQVESLIDSHLIYFGQVSGERYEWMMAGNVIGVDEQDVPELLSKRLGGKLCCGSGNDNRIFQIVGG